MGEPIAVFLCDRTGIMAEPWAEAGVTCYCVDVQHSIRRDRVEHVGAGRVHFVWGDVRTWTPPEGHRIIFGGAFTPCTHQAVSGARDFAKKGGYMLRDGLEMFEAAGQALAWSGAPHFRENPVGVLSSIPHIGKPDHYFHPWEYAGWLADPEVENYTKKTCIWSGNGFVMPEKRPAPAPHRADIWLAPPSDDRADIRAATPRGFSQATFEANRPDWLRRAA